MSENRPVLVLELVSGLAIEATSGGVARFVTELVQAIDRSRVQPLVAALWDYNTPYDRPRAAQLCAAGIPTLLGSDWNEHRAYRSCVTSFRRLWGELPRGVDIIHSHGEFSDLAAVGLQRRLGATCLVRTVHNEIEWSKRPGWGKLFPNLVYPWFFRADLAVSQRAADNLDRRPLAKRMGKHAAYIPNALNFGRVAAVAVDREAKRHDLGIPSGAFVVGSVGRLVRQKGYDVLLTAVPDVLLHCPQAHFVLVGTGALEEDLREQARALGIAGRVTFAGPRADAIEVLKTFDLFVAPSRWEGLPTVVLEAIAAQVPVIATRVSGNVELIEDQVSGLLAPPEEPAALAGAIVMSAARKPQAAEMARRALEHARARFSIDAVAARYADLYCELMAGRPTGATS